MYTLDNPKLMVRSINKSFSVTFNGFYHVAIRISAAVYEALSPVLNELREDLRCTKAQVANLSETVSNLAEQLEQH